MHKEWMVQHVMAKKSQGAVLHETNVNPWPRTDAAIVEVILGIPYS
jgi:hypothetical protein